MTAQRSSSERLISSAGLEIGRITHPQLGVAAFVSLLPEHGRELIEIQLAAAVSVGLTEEFLKLGHDRTTWSEQFLVSKWLSSGQVACHKISSRSEEDELLKAPVAIPACSASALGGSLSLSLPFNARHSEIKQLC